MRDPRLDPVIVGRPALGSALSILVGMSWILVPLLGVLLVATSELEDEVYVERVALWEPGRDGPATLIPGIEGSEVQLLPDGRVWLRKQYHEGEEVVWDPITGASAPAAVNPDQGAAIELRLPAGFETNAQSTTVPAFWSDPPWQAVTLAGGAEMLVFVLRDGAWQPHARMPLAYLSSGIVLPDGKLLLVNDRCETFFVPASALSRLTWPRPLPLPWAAYDGLCANDPTRAVVLPSGGVIVTVGASLAGRWSEGEGWREIPGHHYDHVSDMLALRDGRIMLAGIAGTEIRANAGGIAALAIGVGMLGLAVFTTLWLPWRRRLPGAWIGLLVALGVVVVVGLGLLFVFANMGSGRPLRVGRRLALPRLARRPRGEGERLTVGPWTGLIARRHWRRQARLEASSVVTFERLAAELTALGAPSELVDASREAARDEARHAALCLGLALALGDRPRRPLALDPTLALPRPGCTPALIAHEALVDGVHGEGVAAHMARLAIRDDSAPEVRHALESIARDEGRHAALAWEVLLWCRRSHPAEVEPAVADALLGLSRRPRKELWRGLRAGPWSDALGRWGLFVEAEPGALDRAHARRLATALARGARSAADLAPTT